MPYNQITATGSIALGADPVGPNAAQIRQIIYDALNQGGYTFTWNRQNRQPYQGTFNDGTNLIDVYIYAWRIGNGGRPNLSNEKRIQIQTGVDNVGFSRPITNTQKTILLGIYDCPTGTPIFSAWDATANASHTQKSCQVSVYDLLNGLTHGIYSTNDSRGNQIYTFTPNYLGQYIDLLQPRNALALPTSTTTPLSTRVQAATRNHRITGTVNTTNSIIARISHLSQTEKNAIVKQRVGQGLFRDLLIDNYGCKCALCNISTKSMLIASHIKEWAVCNDTEKLDANNGLLLCAHHDALFDKHLLTFNEITGTPIISPTLSLAEQLELNTASIPTITVPTSMQSYMAYHRANLKR